LAAGPIPLYTSVIMYPKIPIEPARAVSKGGSLSGGLPSVSITDVFGSREVENNLL